MAKEIGVLAFGRMNPPTIGHKKLVDKVVEVARSVNGHPHIFLSHTQNKDKDPLSYIDKIKYAKRAFGDKLVYRSSSRTIIEVMKELEKMGHKSIILVAGSDRVPEFNTLLKKYNGKEYNFDSIEVRSAGERDPDAEGVAGMSASKLRGLAASGRFNEFKKGLPQTLLNNAKEIYNKIRSAMSINEAMAFDITEADVEDILKKLNLDVIDDEDLEDLGVDMVKFIQDMDDEEEEEVNEVRQPLSFAQRRKLGIRMKRLAPRLARQRKVKAKRMATPERILFRARKAAINLLRKKVAGKKGEAYASLGTGQKIQIDKMIMSRRPLVAKIAKRLLPKVRKAEMERLKRARGQVQEAMQVRQDKDIADRPGTQPAKYFKDLSKSTKAARDRHFDKYGDMPDRQGSAYKPAPGDADAETKPSVHTKKFKAMFGEQDAVTRAKERIRQEREAEKRRDEIDKRAQDRRLDRARSQDTQAKNRKTDSARVQTEAKRGRPSKDEAEPDNFIMQLRRVADLNTGGEVKFNDGSKAKISQAIAKHAVGKYNKMNKPADKLKFMRMMQRNVKSFKKQLMAGYDANDQMVPAFDRYRMSMISGSYPRNVAKVENTIYKATDINEAFEQYSGRKPLKAYSMFHADPTAAPLSSVVPRDNYLLEKDIDALKKKAEKSGIPYSTLKKVYDRGMAAWKTGHRPGTTPQQWAFARVNSFVTKGKGTWGGADKDLAKGVRKEEIAREFKLDELSPELKKRYKDKASSDVDHQKMSAKIAGEIGAKDAQKYHQRKAKNRAVGMMRAESYEWGTDASVNHYASGTPGQNFADLLKQRDDQIVPKPELAKTAKQIEREEAMDPSRQKAQDAAMKAIRKMGFKDYKPKEKTPAERDKIRKDQQDRMKQDAAARQKKATDLAKKHGHKLDPKHSGPYLTGYQHGKAGTVDRKASSAYGPGHGAYLKGHEAGSKESKQRNESFDLNESFQVMMGAGYSAAPTANELGIGIQAGYAEHPSVTEAKNRAQQAAIAIAKKEAGINEEADGHCGCNPEPITEAEYQGKTVTLNDPFRTPDGPKKFSVYVKNEKGNVVKVNFGDPNLSIKRDQPERRKSFRARHNCDNPGPKTKARYWSCYQWRSGSKVDD